MTGCSLSKARWYAANAEGWMEDDDDEKNLLAMSARDRRPFVYSQRRSIAREEISKAGLARPDS